MGEAKRRKHSASSALSPADADQIVRHAYDQTCATLSHYENSQLDGLIASHIGRNSALDFAAQNTPKDIVACSARCSACCHQMVLCTPFEVFSIAQYLLKNRSPDEISDLRDKLQKVSALPLHPNNRYGTHAGCPLLFENNCSIYEHRPSVCRALFSASRQQCEASLVAGAGNVNFLAYPQLLATGMQLGIACALRLKCNLDTESVELCGSLLIALDDFENTLEKWLAHDAPFSAFRVRRNGVPTHTDLVDLLIKRLGLQ